MGDMEVEVLSERRAFSIRLVVLATLANFIIAIVIAEFLKSDPVNAYIAGGICSVATVASLASFFLYAPRNFTGIMMVANSLFFIFSYALIYFQFGLEYSGVAKDQASTSTYWDSVYFSIVTLTTLGYGDFQPAMKLRMLAAIQAITGYICLGFIISIFSRWGTSTNRRFKN